MDKEVLCQIDLFQQFQTISWPDGQKDKFTLSELPTVVPQLCREKNVSVVHLYGNDKLLEGIITQIKSEEIFKYGQQQLKFEVN